MAKPVILYPWDSGGLNLVAPTGTHQTNGFVSSEIPTSGEANALAQNTWLWLTWLSLLGTTIRHRTWNPTPISGTTPVPGVSYGNWGATIPVLGLGGTAGVFVQDIDVSEGLKLTSLGFWSKGTSGGSQTIALVVQQLLNADVAPVTLATIPTINVGTSAALSSFVMNATTSGVSIVAATGSGSTTYTRSVGSFLTDGFFVGQRVSWTGFLNAGNNAVALTITALSATVMTVSSTGAAETLATGAVGTAYMPIVDGTFSIIVQVTYNNPSTQTMGLKPLITAVTTP